MSEKPPDYKLKKPPSDTKCAGKTYTEVDKNTNAQQHPKRMKATKARLLLNGMILLSKGLK